MTTYWKAVRVDNGEFVTPLDPDHDAYLDAVPVTWVPGEWVDFSKYSAVNMCNHGVLHCADSLPALAFSIRQLFGYAEYDLIPTIHVFECEVDDVVDYEWMDDGYKIGAKKMRIIGSAKYVVESDNDSIPLTFTFNEIVE